MRETRLSGSEGGGTELNRSFLPLSARERLNRIDPECADRVEADRTTTTQRSGTPRLAVHLRPAIMIVFQGAYHACECLV